MCTSYQTNEYDRFEAFSLFRSRLTSHFGTSDPLAAEKRIRAKVFINEPRDVRATFDRLQSVMRPPWRRLNAK
jgi:hypothetical protein